MNSTKDDNTAPSSKSDDEASRVTSSRHDDAKPPMVAPNAPVGKRRLECDGFPAYHSVAGNIHLGHPDSLTRLMAMLPRPICPRPLEVTFLVPKLVQTSNETNARPGEGDEEVDYGYGVDIVSPPPRDARITKRRRMQRRNSKTPAMLRAMSMNASKIASEFSHQGELVGNGDYKCWEEEDVQIAEDLVRSLKASGS